MPITIDLTGYTWIGNNTISSDNAFNYSINYKCGNYNYSSLVAMGIESIGPKPDPIDIEIDPIDIEFDSMDIEFDNTFDFLELQYKANKFDFTIAYSQKGGWMDESYKTIEITGGTDVTNTDLIAWLEANGTLVLVPPTRVKLSKLKANHKYVGTVNGEYTKDVKYDGNSISIQKPKDTPAPLVHNVTLNKDNLWGSVEVYENGILIDTLSGKITKVIQTTANQLVLKSSYPFNTIYNYTGMSITSIGNKERWLNLTSSIQDASVTFSLSKPEPE